MKLPCTAVLLTNTNSQQCLQAIASLHSFEELLIMDNASELQKKDISHDNYQRIALPETPITDFAKVRNKALNLAQHDWVFFLDSDEILQPFDHSSFNKTLESTTHQAFTCVRSDFFLGKQLHYGEAGNQLLTRLVSKHHTTFTGAIHEVAEVSGTTGVSPLVIYHYSHQSVSSFIADITKYATAIGQQKKLSVPELLFELLLYPPAKLIKTYILLGGFMDGYRGLCYSLVMSLHSLIVRITSYEKNLT